MQPDPELTYCLLLSITGCAAGFGAHATLVALSLKDPPVPLRSFGIRLAAGVSLFTLLGLLLVEVAIALDVLAAIPDSPPLQYLSPWLCCFTSVFAGPIVAQYDSRYWSILRPAAPEQPPT